MQDLELLQFWPPFDVQILRLPIWLIRQNNMVRVPSGMNLAKNVYVWRSNGICKLLSSFSSQPNAEFHLEQIYVLGFFWGYCWWKQTKPATRFPISVSGSHTVCLNLATQNKTCIIWKKFPVVRKEDLKWRTTAIFFSPKEDLKGLIV